MIPPRALTAAGWQTRTAARLGRAEQTARVRIARDELRRVRELTRTINDLQAELGTLVAALAPRLLAERGCGVLTAAKLVGEIADVTRFTSDAKLVRAVTKGRLDPESAAYLARRQAEGKTRREAIRCLKRHLARRVWHLLQPDPEDHRPHQHSTPPRAEHHDSLQPPDRQPSVDIEATSVAHCDSERGVEPGPAVTSGTRRGCSASGPAHSWRLACPAGGSNVKDWGFPSFRATRGSQYGRLDPKVLTAHAGSAGARGGERRTKRRTTITEER